MNGNFDVEFGERVAQLRERVGLTQSMLARRMAEAGFPWHQQTVARIERGKRPVRASELADLALAVRSTRADLLGLSAEQLRVEEIARAEVSFREVARALVTGQMEERMDSAWLVFRRALEGDAS